MADAVVDDKKEKQKVGDANDTMYMCNASREFYPTPKLGGRYRGEGISHPQSGRRRSSVEFPMLEEANPEVPNGSTYIVSEDDETNRHETTYNSACYVELLLEFLAELRNAPE